MLAGKRHAICGRGGEAGGVLWGRGPTAGVPLTALIVPCLAGGVVYNAARVSLSERSRELASLRVLGFTRGEISAILLGELAVVTLMAIPIGLMMGYLFAGLLVAAFDAELYRIPLVVSTGTFAAVSRIRRADGGVTAGGCAREPAANARRTGHHHSTLLTGQWGILRRLQQSEAVVPLGQPLLEVGDLSDMEIVSDLLSIAAVRVLSGQPVRIEQWGGDRVLLNGRRVEASGFTKVSALGVEEQPVNVLIDFEDPRDLWKALGMASGSKCESSCGRNLTC